MLSVSPLSAHVGAPLTLADKTVNAGTALARASLTGFFLSVDRRVAASDIRLGARRVPALEPRHASSRRTQVTVPGATAPGDYFVIACADDRKKVRESRERNNCRVTAVRVAIQVPSTSTTPEPTTPGTAPPDAGAPAPGGSTDAPAAALTINRQSSDFGAAVSGTSTASVDFTVTNSGTATSGALGSSLAGTNPGDFKITSDSCAGSALAAASACAIAVDFAPGSAGAKSATLAVTATPGGTVSANLSGTACSNSTTWTVDVAHGSDTNAGTCAAPFKTITKALAVAASGNSVKVDPGEYGASTGETFPLAVPAGVSLIGDTAGRGTNPVTKITGDVGAAHNALIEGFWVVGTMTASANNATLFYNTVNHAGATCIQTASGTGVLFEFNTVTGCGYGIVVTSSGGPALTSNTVTGDGYGVEIDSPATADLGGGVLGSAGGNVLSCSTNADVWTNLASGTLHAQYDYWDHNPPTTGTATGGIDIYQGGGTVSTTGALVVANPCP